MVTTHRDKDGVQMLFKSKGKGGEYYLSDAGNIKEGKFITTDHNDAEKKTEGNIAFWRVSAKDVHYGDHSIGKTVRVNINAGGGLDGHQQNRSLRILAKKIQALMIMIRI